MRWLVLLFAPAVLGCSGTLGHASDAGPELGASDTGAHDGGVVDNGTGTGTDLGGTEDLGAPDLGGADDLGPPDLGPPDLGLPCSGGPTTIDLHSVVLHSNPPTLADWPVTTQLTEVDFTPDGVHVEFDKLDGPGRWPDIVPPGWDGPLQYTLGLVECIDGAWHASAVIEYWYGLSSSGGNVAEASQIAVNWYYDAGRWGELAGRQPATGETVGVFVAAGNLRNITTDDPLQSPVMERSNVVLVPFPDVSGATHSF